MDKSMQVIAVYLLSHIGLIFFMYPTDIIESLSVGHWCAILLGFACHVAVIAIYTKGLSYFKSQSIIDIFAGAGKALAWILLLPVSLYFLMMLILTVRAYAEIVTIIFLDSTPLWAVMALFLAVAGLISFMGVEAMFRTGLLAAILFFPLLLFVLSVSFQNADWHYLYPIMDKRSASFSFVLERPYLLSFFAFAGGFLFLGFIPPYVPYKRRAVLWTTPVLLPFFFVSVYVPLLTFGRNTAVQFQFPFIMAVDTADISWLMFDRVTMFFMITVICFALLFISLVMWKTTLMIRRVLPFVRPDLASLLLAAVVFVICLQIPNWKMVERLFWWNTYLRLYVVAVIPLTTLVLGIRRRRKGAAGI
ncbi:GerAB/ArcD/ProY family transporter [Cohnella zeiphila]|uniref:GerAB/ArcD/ProY family transporter n=1 Tax=Cohnella zeiphila TaxID=2761120 RepID=A0A7X0SSI0_9BACL|nr:GerAB/ArcD/ProY family transporter [Cohnella zeiphila]MBB6735301.1 GerAB/ArcD/ProY family transporter [Cohnella zeiphila]